MSQEQKFGTFGGVFTPSILTILGVIMYMRLPWIVGQAGFFVTVGIIIVAHIVSITTGLSVSSIATDKKVKAGGTYYIISRSLGLPIGGTLGVALFFGLSMSVSLYLIGFSESFLGFWGMEITKDAIRLTGTIVLFIVGTLTFISTSLAIKTQYFIMAAIVLSLVTIIFGSTDFVPAKPLLNPSPEMSPLILMFAIFFPAVTGFEAGVSMSGDLKDPKKSIPVGTIAAIVLGLFVYIGLAAFFAYRVNADQLINNPNILIDLSFFPPLLVAGIWGATISSAIGSILGAPRILQATSSDHITPRIFAKGYGKTNEPRNALLLTFAIAEAGILIGELNLIARVVSMFFITTYGFLNLSSALEKWASTDFRPSFKIPTAVSIIGAIVCFILMLELDFLALIGASIIMVSVFIYLKRKELTLESGDTWEGVWASVLRSGLNRLSKTVKQQRNWRPNIILFSGGSAARPHLIEFGRWLVHRRGILSNFNLLENKKSNEISPKLIPELEDTDEKFQGIFTRQMEVSDIYRGIETITKVYGFAGIEPNSVMLGWARNTKNPEAFAALINNIKNMDYNVFILDYHKTRGFGVNKTIDLWWRGGSNNFTLGLTLVKFLQMSDDWDESKARIFIVINDSSLKNKIYKNVNNMLEEQRISASLNIINNAIERNPVPEIIKRESANSDLVILGIPEVKKDSAGDFISDTDQLIESLGSVMLVQAASFFKPIYIGIEDEQTQKLQHEVLQEQQNIEEELYSLVLPEHEVLANAIQIIINRVKEAFTRYQKTSIEQFQIAFTLFIKDFEKLMNKNFVDLAETVDNRETHRSRKYLARAQSNYLFNSRRIVQNYQKTLVEHKDNLSFGLQSIISDFQKLLQNTEEQLTLIYTPEQTTEKSGLGKLRSIFRFSSANKPIRRKVHLRKLLDITLQQIERNIIYSQLEAFSLNSYTHLSDIHKFFISVTDSSETIEAVLLKGAVDKSLIKNEMSRLNEQINAIKNTIENQNKSSLINAHHDLQQALQTMSKLSEKEQIAGMLKRKLKKQKKKVHPETELQQLPDYIINNQQLINNFFIEDLFLKQFQNRVETILERFFNDVQINIDTNYTDKLNTIKEVLESLEDNPESPLNWPLFSQDGIQSREDFNNLLKDIQAASEELPENLEILSEESFQNIEKAQFNDVSTVKINLRRHVEFLIETELIDALQELINDLTRLLHKNMDVAQEVVRFTNFNQTLAGDVLTEPQESLATIVSNGLKRINAEKENILLQKQKIQTDLKQLLQNTFDKMNPYLISRSAGELVQTIRTQEGRKFIENIKEQSDHFKSWSKSLVTRLIYQRSEGVLIAQKIGQTTGTYQTETGKILETVRLLSPDIEVQKALPFYYRQLFLGKRMVNREFIINRQNEMERAENLIDLYKQGYKGALLILGDRNSGKSTYCRRIADRFFDLKKNYHIFAPEGGSTNPADLQRRLTEALNQHGDFDTIFNALPAKSTIIFHDLELWWARNNAGFNVLKIILNLIDRYSDRCLFVINADTQSYKFINRLYHIENAFIGVLECQPYDSEELQQAIMLRHRASGLKFEFNNQSENSISNLRLARLFNKYFDISNGNIGQAMHYWISNIAKVQPQFIQIRDIQKPTDQTFSKLNNEWLILLQQFHLHKQLSIERLKDIMHYDLASLEPLLLALRRSGLIVEIQPNILQISPFIQPQIQNRLTEMDLL